MRQSNDKDIMSWWVKKVVYCETSPSGIRWTKNMKVAGSLNPNGYWYVGSFCGGVRVTALAHRIIYFMHNSWDFGDIDHIDGNRSCNVVNNLRLVTTQLNCRNSSMRSDNTTGFTGVSYEPARPKSRTSARYKAVWIDECGRSRAKSFPISKFGDMALSCAAEFREEMIRKLNELGCGYTDRHGS